jgi:PTH1 family peptidyl-tRNA hydrolase
MLVVGLGNPGRGYAAHRHNVGFMVIDELAARVRSDPFREKFSGLFARAELGGHPAVLLKPMTYMNESGRAVEAAMTFFKIDVADVVALHDELDLPFGTVRLKFGGGHVGHNGLRSMMAATGSGEFGRVRIGIGRPPPDFRGEVADYVLSRFDAVDAAILPELLKRAAESVLEVASRGFKAAMNVRNTREKPKKEPKDGAEGPSSGSAPPPPGDGTPKS